MPISFPVNPSLNQVFDTGTFSFVWNGSSWVANGSPPSADLTINAASSAGSYANAAFIHANSAFAAANSGAGGVQYNANTSANGFFALPVGNTAQRPAQSANGHVRYNTTTGEPEWYDGIGNQWLGFSKGANYLVEFLIVLLETYVFWG